MLIGCDEKEATHVEILKDEDDHYEMCNVIIGKAYKILENDQPGYEGEEMIEAENGDFLCSFSLVLDVKWMKKAK